MKEKKNPIGIFDSGIGGLLIVKEMKKQMPYENFIYFGDTKNMPYGNKSKNFIIEHSIKLVTFLYKKKCKALLIACNSITSNALDIIIKKFRKKILIFNVIDPIIKKDIFLSSKKIGILATPATVKSNFYIKNIKKHSKNLDIIQVSAPLLAYFIEKNIKFKNIKNYVIKNYLEKLGSIDTLILACTHYLFIKEEIKNYYYNKKVRLIDIQKIVTKEIKNNLYKNELLSFNIKRIKYSSSLIFYNSKISSSFKKIVYNLFGKKVLIKKGL